MADDTAAGEATCPWCDGGQETRRQIALGDAVETGRRDTLDRGQVASRFQLTIIKRVKDHVQEGDLLVGDVTRVLKNGTGHEEGEAA